MYFLFFRCRCIAFVSLTSVCAFVSCSVTRSVCNTFVYTSLFRTDRISATLDSKKPREHIIFCGYSIMDQIHVLNQVQVVQKSAEYSKTLCMALRL